MTSSGVPSTDNNYVEFRAETLPLATWNAEKKVVEPIDTALQQYVYEGWEPISITPAGWNYNYLADGSDQIEMQYLSNVLVLFGRRAFYDGDTGTLGAQRVHNVDISTDGSVPVGGVVRVLPVRDDPPSTPGTLLHSSGTEVSSSSSSRENLTCPKCGGSIPIGGEHKHAGHHTTYVDTGGGVLGYRCRYKLNVVVGPPQLCGWQTNDWSTFRKHYDEHHHF
jgi:hypothetical protein